MSVNEETLERSVAQQNIDAVKTMYEAFGRGDLPTILDHCAEDVDWASEAAIEVAPWQGVKRGKHAVPEFFSGIAQVGPVTVFDPVSFTANDEGDVMVYLRYTFTVNATGKEVATHLQHFFRFGEDGKLTYVRVAEDTAAIAAALAP